MGGFLGIGEGAGGTDFAAPAMPNLIQPVTQDQVSGAYTGVQGGLKAQQDLLAALQAQHGIQNQSDVYGQLQNVAAGKGPNPAQAMLNQQTGQNVANQASLMAGQRGAASNVGLMARQAAQQGARTQQNAIGQGATLQAEQSLGALGQAGNMATTQAGQQIGATQGLTGAQLQEQQNLLGALGGYNSNLTGAQGSINSANAGMAQSQMQGQQGLIGGIFNGIGGALGLAGGGDVSQNKQPLFNMGSGPQSGIGQHLFNMGDSNNSMQSGSSNMFGGLINLLKGSGGDGGSTPSMNAPLSGPNMMTLPLAKGGSSDYRAGGKVQAKGKGEKAKVSGDSYANDKIKAVLSEHEIVLPRSITMAPNAPEMAAKFVAQEISKRKMKG